MTKSPAPIAVSEISNRFTELLAQEGTSRENPNLDATWRAFANFSAQAIKCDDERLFFEADISSTQPDSFYIHFSRTCYGRQPAGHVWSHELICDFVFPLESSLENFNVTVEVDELFEDSDGRDQFLAEVQNQGDLWDALKEVQPISTQIYVGES